jgi:hypothetical protein
MNDRGAVHLAPIQRADFLDVGTFLHLHLNEKLLPSAWAAAIAPTWAVVSPNHGFLLRHGGPEGPVVGVQLAFYSTREIDGVEERFCNLAAWCVLEPYRTHGVRMLRAVLAQKGYTFTDLSPSGTVVEINRRLRFESLDTSAVLVPNLPLTLPGSARVITDRDVIAQRLDGDELRIFRDHQHAAAALHLLIVDGDDQCYVILRRDRRRGLPLFASVLHASNPEMLGRRLPDLGRHLLLHHRRPFTLVELRRLGSRPRFSRSVRSPRPKMYRSAHVPAESIDDLYSELALVRW